MGPRANASVFGSGLERVRARLLTALHLGQAKPGSRAPSIRRMAALTQLDPKTIHRAYRSLAHEGLLDTRPGSGTFYSEPHVNSVHKPLASSLLETVERCRVEANHLGVDSDIFLRFLELFMGRGLQGVPIAVAECNREQIGLIERELRAGLGVATREMLITELVAHHPSLLSTVRGVVTTDCHRQEVAEIVAPLGIPVYRVALAPEFTTTLIRYARKAPLSMVVSDGRYAAVLRRMLRQMQVPRDVIAQFRFIRPAELASPGPGAPRSVYVSPLLAREVGTSLPPGLRRVKPGRYLAATSVESLKAQLALDLAMR